MSHPPATPAAPAAHLPAPSRVADALSRLRASPVVLCIRTPSPTTARACAEAALAGGLRTIEVTFTTPDAPALIRALRAAHPSALIAAGTVLTPADLSAAIAAGAAFALSPVHDPDLVAAAAARDFLLVPAAATPTEAFAAHRAGAPVVKLFPVDLCGGLAFVRALAGPLPHVPLLPTSGVTIETLPAYLAQPNVVAVGASRQILAPAAVAAADWADVSARAARWAAAAAAARPTGTAAAP